MKKEPGKFSVRSRASSFRYAFKGLVLFFTTQPNALIHAVAAVIAVTLGFLFDITAWEWGLVIIAIGLVLASEAFNTSIEFLTDLVSPGYNEKAGKVKDLAAAAVLISAIIAAALGCIVFLPRILLFFQGS
jgi:diacylglycerol kinase (ATP)